MNFLVRANKNDNAKFQDDELGVLFDLITSGQGTYDYLMSSEGNEEWEFAQEEGNWDDREEWAKDTDHMNMMEGNAAHYFSAAEHVTKPWCIHFTDSDPHQIMSEGFIGHEFHGIGLTKQYKEGTHKGPYVFAYPFNSIKEMFKYGKNAVLFQAKEGIQAWHSGDEETQIIVNKDKILKMFALVKDDDEMLLEDKKGTNLAVFDTNKLSEQIKKFLQIRTK